MGLDQYAYFVNPENVDRDGVEIAINQDKHTDGGDYYWRKFNALQGWMEKLYNSKGGVKEFNCVDVELTKKDLTQLKKDMKKGLTPTTGFFFGAQEVSEYDLEVLQRFIVDATLALEDGKVVVYSSWW